MSMTKIQWFAHKIQSFFRDTLFPFMVLLLAPEWVLMWAIRQRLTVEYLIREKGVPTRRHAFFIIMGGFHKFDKVGGPTSASLNPAPPHSSTIQLRHSYPSNLDPSLSHASQFRPAISRPYSSPARSAPSRLPRPRPLPSRSPRSDSIPSHSSPLARLSFAHSHSTQIPTPFQSAHFQSASSPSSFNLGPIPSGSTPPSSTSPNSTSLGFTPPKFPPPGSIPSSSSTPLNTPGRPRRPNKGRLSVEKMDEESYGKPDHPLDRFDVCRLVKYGSLELPPEVEIDDKSKSDWIAKSLVLIQTLWFTVQCIARKRQGLPWTELELVTFGYALLNFIIYLIWWQKPQKVERPIRVFSEELPTLSTEQSAFMQKMETSKWYSNLFTSMIGIQDQRVLLRGEKHTPTFYSGHPPKDWSFATLPLELVALMITAVIGALFGGIHLIAWSAPFPTRKMLILWRWGSILMILAPIPTLTLCVIMIIGNYSGSIRKGITANLFAVCTVLSCSLVPLVYVAGRVITLMIAFQTLPTLPPDAYRSVRWTNLVPHL